MLYNINQMSIVCLKRKSRHIIDPISGKGKNGFSLVGGHRNIGSVGPTNLAKSVTRTPFRGALPMGSGGCCGSYVVNICNSGSCCTNDSEIIKKTVKNNSGMLMEKYKWMSGTYPNWWVKPTPDQGPVQNQSTYISEVSRTVGGRCGTTFAEDAGKNSGCSYLGVYDINNVDNVATVCKTRIGTSRRYYTLMSKSPKCAISSSQYQQTQLQKNNCLPTPPNRQHFPMVLVHNGCDVNYNTWQEAKAAGALPADWQP
jgi:hypothetical protein